MSHASDVEAPNAERREQPFLYTWNRRLRHLHGISLRNLNISPPNSRARGKTVTDDEYNLKTPAKTLLRDEAGVLHHAKSYDQLLKASAAEELLQSPYRASTSNEYLQQGKGRPVRGSMRRRSTLHWATSNPRARQSKLEDVEMDRLVNTWFSIHHEELEMPIYISEVVENAMNPTFSLFDLDVSASRVMRSDTFKLVVWSNNEPSDDYRMLIELHVNMRSLQFVGRSLENFHHPLPENCVLFHLPDGMYTSFTDLSAEQRQQPSPTQAMKAMAPAQTAPFDALLKLANLDDVMQDAQRTRAKLEADINDLLARMPQAEHDLSRLSSQRENTRSARRARETEHKSTEHSGKVKFDLQTSLQARSAVLKSLPERRLKAQEECDLLNTSSQKIRKDLENLDELAQAQVRRISTCLTIVFPIEPIKNKTLQFTIRNIHLPNSSFSDTNSDEIAAALSYTGQLVYQLSLYLSIPLPYPIEPNGPNTTIHDEISAGIAQRQYSLHPSSGASYKFEYGVFLLNKDVEFLLNRSGLRVMDIRHTLPNLKYLLFVLTAGSGDLPSRKAGGIRGLLQVRMTPNVSRRNSAESIASQMSSGQEKVSDRDEVSGGPFKARGLPYRKSMLRDAG